MPDHLQPYSAVKDSGTPSLGEVPAHWNMQRLKTVFREKDERSGDGAGTLLSLTRKKGLVPHSEVTDRLASAADLSKYKVCMAGDLVMNRMQAWSGMFACSSLSGLVSPDYSVFSCADDSQVMFFEHLLKIPAIVDEFAKASKGIGSGFNRLYTDDFGTVRVPVPPAEEQAGIVRFLDWADRRIRQAIRAKQKLVKLLEEQKQAIIHRAVTRGLDPDAPLKPSGVEWLGDVPAHWEVWPIGYFAKVGNGSTPSRGNASYWTSGTYPWLNSSSVNAGAIVGSDQFVTEVAMRECHLPWVSAGSLLVAITGQGKTRGKAAALTIDATINQHIAFITPRTPDSVVTIEFLRRFLDASYAELRRMSDDSGSTKGALTCEDLKHFHVLRPPISEQIRIVQYITELTVGIVTAQQVTEREIELLREYRTRLIADVVTGKLDVREAAAKLTHETQETDPDDVSPPDVELVADDIGGTETALDGEIPGS